MMQSPFGTTTGRIRPLLLFVFFALCALPTFAGETDFEKLKASADALLRQRRYRDAIGLLEKVVAEAPVESPVCLAALRSIEQATVSLSGSGPERFVPAAERLLERIRKTVKDPAASKNLQHSVLTLLASHHRTRRRYDAAIECYRRLREISTEREAVLIDRSIASIYEDAGDNDKALAICQKQLAADPKQQPLRAQVARLLLKLGRTGEARELLSTEPPATLYNIASDLQKAEYLPQAEMVARTIVNKHPGAKSLLGRVCFEQKKFDEAATLLREGLMETDDTDYRLTEIADKLTEVYTARGGLADTIAAIEKEIAGLGLAAETRPARRKLLLLLAKLKEANGDPCSALDTLLARQALLDKQPPGSTSHLTKTARSAVARLRQEGRSQDIEALLNRLNAAGVKGAWIDSARYAILADAGKKKEAEELLAKLEAEAKTEAELYSLASELGRLDHEESHVRLCKRIVAMEPHGSVYDANAHVALANYCMKTEQFKEAKAHCDAVDENTSADSMGIIGIERFRRMEALATYRAAGDDAEELVKMLSDEREDRRIAGARLLGEYGKLEHVPILEALSQNEDAPPRVRAAARAAIGSVRARGAAALVAPQPMTEEQMKTRIARLGNVLWIREDPFERTLRWAGIEKRFVLVVDLKSSSMTEFGEALAFLGYEEITPRAIVFTDEVVWVGTNRGLFAFERWSKSWNAYSVGLKHLDCPVTNLVLRDRQLIVTVELAEGTRTYSFDPVAGKWAEEP